MTSGTQQPYWHALSPAGAAEACQVNPGAGLSSAEASRRLLEHGPNEMTARTGRPAWIRFLQQFNQALVWILLVAVAVSAALGEFVDAAVILVVVLINAIVGFLQEAKAERAIEALARMVRTEATVRREGRRRRLPAAELVPGDIVLLQSGDRVPADLRLIQVRSLQVEEAALTGESVPVRKLVDALPADTVLGDRRNLGFAGTLVTFGQGEGVVFATGDRTEAGRIAAMIHEAADLSTPLTRKIAQFSGLLLYVILGFSLLTFLAGLLHGESPAVMFMAAVALAVGAIPEGLPAAVTITLAIGVSRMARRNAIIRRMPAVETLGSTTVICSDKTGTLTENQMTVSRVYAAGRIFEVTGGGYEADGRIERDGQALDPAKDAALHECLLCGLLCNDTQVVRKEGRLEVEGDPTEAALLVSAQKAGLVHEAEAARRPRLDVIPFESEHMYMATLHESDTGRVAYAKGSVERLLERSNSQLDAVGRELPLDAGAVHAAVDAMASEGLRVLAFARRRFEPGKRSIEHGDVAEGLTLLGLQGMIDPPRAEAIRAVADCQSAGIAVKMITGDHAGTARAIGRQLGLSGAGAAAGEVPVVTGRQLDAVPDEQLPELVERTAVFARVAPEQKLRLVRTLQGRGHIVAMTGDGVNDAPALKQADIGVAMGITGTDVAKGAADMVLTDDNFASIEAAVEEGRNVFDNLTKFIAWTMPTNGGEALLVLTSVLLGTALPILPVQLLWVNMGTALLLGLMLVFEPKESGIMERRPRQPDEPLLTKALVGRIALVSILMLVGAFALFLWERGQGASIEQARTAVVNVIVVVEALYLLNCRSLTRSFFSLGIFTNPWVLGGIAAMLAMQALFTYAPFMNRLFHSAPLGGLEWLKIFGVGLGVFGLIELKKVLQAGASGGRPC